MLSRYMRMFLVSLVVLSLASSAFAARRSSLGGNLLIKDADEVFFFPHRVGDYNRMVTFDFGTSSGLGSGGMIFGNETLTFGAFTHRSDFIGSLPGAFLRVGDYATISNDGASDFANAFSGGLPMVGPAGGALQWIDVILGWQSGDLPFGARISVGRNQFDEFDSAPDPDMDAKSDVTSVNVVLGIELNDIDFAGEFSLASAQTKPDDATSRDTTPVHFSVGARKTAMDESDDLQVGWVGLFTYINGGGKQESGGSTSEINESQINVVAGIGPVYTPHERTSVAMYGTFEFMHNSTSQDVGDTEDKQTMRSYVIPGWHIAAEVELASWLQARAAMVSKYMMNSDKNESGGDTDTETKSTALDFSWHAGIGVQFDNFSIDGYFDPSVLTSGTDLLGTESDLFGMVTASLGF